MRPSSKFPTRNAPYTEPLAMLTTTITMGRCMPLQQFNNNLQYSTKVASMK